MHHRAQPRDRATLAGLKMFRDEWDSADFAYLFVRDQESGVVSKWVAIKRRGMSSIGESPFRINTTWEWETEGEPVPYNRMPMTGSATTAVAATTRCTWPRWIASTTRSSMK